MESKHNDSIFCIQELANLIPSAMDSTIYAQATLELHRRDDLLTVLNYNVSNNIKRDLRLSQLGQEHVFEPEVCLRAGKEVLKKLKSGEIQPRRGGGNFRGGRGRGRGGGRFSGPGSMQARKDNKMNQQFPKPNKATTYAANNSKRGKPVNTRGGNTGNTRGGAKRQQFGGMD